MKRSAPVVLVLVVILVVAVWRAQRWQSSRETERKATASSGVDLVATGVVVTAISSLAVTPTQTQPLLGETILRDYANPNLPPENDLTLMSHLMENALLLLKSAANRPLSANEDWADLLRGQNAARERFLPDQHVALNASGQLVDRWGTPLFFHALGGGRYEIRSAGADKKLWTADDIHRNADGSFRRGENLNPESLLPETGRR